ncbi:hypothetical protein BN3087_240049 [Sulfurovum sp. enrichment culture clone C5]|uniref:Uncharacterized protein n=1 Tax=Sulfurovum sp. enrichment culture clone C5 TaxID=497650 RepID=A0A0S4XMM2_9BACT|nr:hypothetical protein BN3087_240049 [Sulfurovum sp. enrichment culture clone C5]
MIIYQVNPSFLILWKILPLNKYEKSITKITFLEITFMPMRHIKSEKGKLDV